MGRIVFAAMILLWPTITYSQGSSLNKVRETYFGLEASECNALKLSDYFEANPPSTAIMIAYFGASSAAAPACLLNPASKISYFRRGKKMLAKAVEMQPDNFEIRFLRFATQTMTPAFLNYNQNIEEDKIFILSHIESGRNSINNVKLFDRIIQFLLKSDFLTDREKSKLTLIKT